MSQAQTLQDIYSKIADIYDKFCNLGTTSDTYTSIASPLVLDNNAYTSSSGITLTNPTNSQEITDAQTQLNSLLTLALKLAKDDRLSTDEIVTQSDGSIIPIPKGSPIALLPELIKVLVLFKAPLKVLLNIVVNIIEEVLLEHIKRKLNEKTAQLYGVTNITASAVVKIPKDAEKLYCRFTNIPNWVGQRFEPPSLDKSIFSLPPLQSTNLIKYTLGGLGTLSFGVAMTGALLTKPLFWDSDIKIEYDSQIFDIPSHKFVNNEKYAFIYLNYSCSCELGFLRSV